MNYYYESLKEQRILTLMSILRDSKDILNQLDELEKEFGIENIISFYDELIEIIKMGFEVKSEDIHKYYKLYSGTFLYAGMNMSYALRSLQPPVKDLMDELFAYLPWYSRLWIKIKNMLRINKTR